MIWSKNMYRCLSYADRLGDVQAPTLILARKHDPQASLACSQELFEGIRDGELVVFEKCGHTPFVEEASLSRTQSMHFLTVAKLVRHPRLWLLPDPGYPSAFCIDQILRSV